MARSHPLPAAHPTDRIVGHAPAIQALRAQIRHLASFDGVGNPHVPTVLLHGETGTGKGLVARVIHDSGPRAHGPFVDVNCAAVPETLLEAELFGFAAGAFTDAKRAKPGLFEAASGGTLLLDEIDALPLSLQGKLLTVIEEKRVRRLGAVGERSVDVKLIAASQAELGGLVQEGRFRGDLYQRLAVVLLDIPPLRDRGEDVVLLAQQWLRQYAEAYRLSPKRLTVAAEGWLRSYHWPGNVRELSHLLERVTLVSAETIIDPECLERLCLPRLPSSAQGGPAGDVREPEDVVARITQALRQTGGNVERAARLLGLSRKAVRYRMQRYGIERPREGRKPLRPLPQARQGTAALPAPSLGEDQRGRTAHPEGQGEGTSARLDAGQAQAPPQAWERKPVAVLALELSWPAPTGGVALRYEPWTVTSRWQQLIVEKLQGFGGVVLQRAPSLLLVAFGIPHTLEQLPQRAVQGALALRQLVANTPAGDGWPELRQVVHWGELLVDVEARDPTAQLLPIGDTLARPVRLLGLALPGDILVSPKVAPVVEGWYALQACEGPLRGKSSDQIAAYTVLGLRPHASPLEMHAQRPLSHFVGRERELATLSDLLVQVEEGRGQVVGMLGEPGIGKSRLCYEFIRAHLPHQWLCLDASAASYGKDTPYLPVIDLLKAYFQLDASGDVQTRRATVTAKLLALEPALQPILPALLVLLEVPIDDPQWQALEPPQRRQRIMDAVKQLLLRESQVQPLCLIVENLHWIDGETQALLDSFVESLPAARVLLLVSYRPDSHHGWTSKTYYTQLRLDPLPPTSAQALASSILGHDPSVLQLTRHLIEWTEGNPLFLEESLQTLVETQALSGERGAYRLTQAWQPMQVPATVHMVLAARLDRLPGEAKRLLQIAAVIGKEVPFSLLHAIAERPAEALRQGLAHLQRAEFLYERSLVPELVYTFKHALSHEVAYGSLLQDHRRILHAGIVSALETLSAERLAEQVERLAHHALQGEVWEKAVSYCRQAGEKARHRGAFREAVTYDEQALAALSHLPAHPDTGELAIELHQRFGSLLSQVGEHARSLALLGEAEARARQRGDRARLGQVLARMVTRRLIVGDVEGALAAGREALELAATLGAPTLQAHASYRLGQAYAGMGDYRRAAELLRGNVTALARSTPDDMRHWCFRSQAQLAPVLGSLGEFAEGRRHGEEALRLAIVDGHWQGDAPITARARLGSLYLAQGDLEAAIWMFEEGLALCRASGLRVSLGGIAEGLGEAYAHTGRLAEGLALLEEARRDDLRTGALGGHYVSHLRQLSAVLLLAGRIDEAGQHARQALDLAREQKVRGHEAQALFQLGAIHAEASPPDVSQAEMHYREALTLAEALGMRPLQAHCHHGLGTLYAKSGRPEPARTALSTAIELYRAMDMTFWLPQAEAALAQVEGPVA
jgi:DNA-binding NtrC family response regulator/tetratricopeptide (TPR) repeat protein